MALRLADGMVAVMSPEATAVYAPHLGGTPREDAKRASVERTPVRVKNVSSVIPTEESFLDHIRLAACMHAPAKPECTLRDILTPEQVKAIETKTTWAVAFGLQEGRRVPIAGPIKSQL